MIFSYYRYKDHLRAEIFAADAKFTNVKESTQEHGVYSWCNTDKNSTIQSSCQYVTATT